ncbi:MAG: hypothetical protein WCK29_01335 [archaeon]
MIEEISFTIDAHQNHPKKPSKAFRKWDGKTPYSIHPIWSAMTILTETDLDEKTRMEGYQTLIYHDVKEDTNKPLPSNLESRILELVNHMTFEGGSEQEMQEIWGKPKEVRLYKLYDKVSNLLDASWMTTEKRAKYEEYLGKLTLDAEKNYGILNITKIARAIGRIK